MTGIQKQLPRPEYRLFFLAANNRILGRLDLRQAVNDKSAIKEARALRYPGVHELWNNERLIQRFEAAADSDHREAGFYIPSFSKTRAAVRTR